MLEVDEHYLPEVLTSTQPKVVALLNLSRDQLDRAKEVAMIADLWRRTLAQHRVHVVANADDPMITWAAAGATGAGAGVTWVAAGQRWHDDSWVCPECGSHIERAVTGERSGDGTGAGDMPVAPQPGTAPPADPPASPAGVEVVDEVTVVASDGGALDGATELITAVPAVAIGAQPGVNTARGNAAGRPSGSVDERTMLMPTVPVPEAAYPAGRPLGSAGSHPATPVLAPIATPQTVADTIPGLPTSATPTPGTPTPGTIPSSVPMAATATTADGADWWCTGCALRRPTPQWRVEGDAVSTRPAARTWSTSNCRAGSTAPTPRPRSPSRPSSASTRPLAAPRLAQVASVAGRYAQVQRDGRNIRLLLAKNPAGWLEAFDMAEDVPTLLSINARDPDGLDTSWLFDVDFSPLRGRHVLITGDRAYDLAVRLDVNDIPFSYVRIVRRGAAIACRPAGSRSSRTTPRSRTSERSWTVSTDRAATVTTGAPCASSGSIPTCCPPTATGATC